MAVKLHLGKWQTDLPNREVKLVRCLVNLFEEVDINGNGLLEWKEFQNYIIDKATVINSVRTRQQHIKPYTKSSYKPDRKFASPISKILYIAHLDRIAFIEENSDEVQVLCLEGQEPIKTLRVQPKPMVFKISVIKKDANGNITVEKKDKEIQRNTKIIDILYIPD